MVFEWLNPPPAHAARGVSDTLTPSLLIHTLVRKCTAWAVAGLERQT